MTKKNPMWALVLVVAMLGLAHLGIEVFRATPAEAQARRGYSECFFAKQEYVDVNDQGIVGQPSQNRMIRVPSGWTVVSAGGGRSYPSVLFCR